MVALLCFSWCNPSFSLLLGQLETIVWLDSLLPWHVVRLRGRAFGVLSESGWVDAGAFKGFIDHLHTRTEGRLSVLLCDAWCSHIAAESVEYAKRKMIQMLIVPPGMTSKRSPLDVGVIGLAKAVGAKKHRRRRLLFPHLVPTLGDAVQCATEAFMQITPTAIKSAWKKAVNLVAIRESTRDPNVIAAARVGSPTRRHSY